MHTMPIWVDEDLHQKKVRKLIEDLPMVKMLGMRVTGFSGPEEYRVDPATEASLAEYIVKMELDPLRATQLLHAGTQVELNAR